MSAHTPGLLPSEFCIVFDGPPSHDAGRFVEVENGAGQSIRLGEWHERADGLWELRFKNTAALELLKALEAALFALCTVETTECAAARYRARAAIAKAKGEER